LRNLFIIVLLLCAGTLNASSTGEQKFAPVAYGEGLPAWSFGGG